MNPDLLAAPRAARRPSRPSDRSARLRLRLEKSKAPLLPLRSAPPFYGRGVGTYRHRFQGQSDSWHRRADTINALSGNDTVYGRAGNDRLYGGLGDRPPLRRGRQRHYSTAAPAPTRWKEAPATMPTTPTASRTSSGKRPPGAADGTDTVYASVNFTLGANLEHLTMYRSAKRGEGDQFANASPATPPRTSLRSPRPRHADRQRRRRPARRRRRHRSHGGRRRQSMPTTSTTSPT